MVCTRSGVCFALPPHKELRNKKKTKFLLCNMFRTNGDDSVHKCIICMSKFMLHSSAKWMQCPQCKDVFHERCIENFAMKTNNISALKCPSCRSADLPFNFEQTSSHILVEWNHNTAEAWWYDGVEKSSDSEPSDESDKE